MGGDFVEFNFNSGNWDTEITYQIYDPSSVQLGSYGPYPIIKEILDQLLVTRLTQLVNLNL